MQLTSSSSIVNLRSNSNGSPANGPAATTTQDGARASATPLARPPSLPAVVIPPGSRLTDHQITYTDLPNGPHHVEHQSDLLRVPDGQDARVIKRVVKFVDDPDSLAIVLAVPTRRPGVMRPVLGITHRKLRYLFNVAINWSLSRDRLHFQDGAVAMYTSTSRLDDLDETVACLPDELTAVDVRSDGLNFDPPTITFVEPQTIRWRLIVGVLALLAGFLFVKAVMFSLAVVLQATETDTYAYVVYATARDLDAVLTVGIVAFFQET